MKKADARSHQDLCWLSLSPDCCAAGAVLSLGARLVSLHSPVQCQTDMSACPVLPQKSVTQHCIEPCRYTQGRLKNLNSFLLPSGDIKCTDTLFFYSSPCFALFNIISHAIWWNLTDLLGSWGLIGWLQFSLSLTHVHLVNSDYVIREGESYLGNLTNEAK